MGRFEKKIRNRAQQSTEDFDAWFKKNAERFPEFVYTRTEEEQLESRLVAVKAKKKKIILIPITFFFVAVCVFLCFLPMILSNESTLPPAISEEPGISELPDGTEDGQESEESPSSGFGDDRVHGFDMSVSEQNSVVETYPFTARLQSVSFRKLLKIDDDSIVFMIISGELETEDDYYFVKMQIEIDPNYFFLEKPIYELLEHSVEVGGKTVRYQFWGEDSGGLYLYYLTTEWGGRTVYLEVSCFTESIDAFMRLVFS